MSRKSKHLKLYPPLYRNNISLEEDMVITENMFDYMKVKEYNQKQQDKFRKKQNHDKNRRNKKTYSGC